MQKRDGKLVDAFGPPEDWTHHRIQKRYWDRNRYRMLTATITSEEHFQLIQAGLTKHGAITDKGRKLINVSS